MEQSENPKNSLPLGLSTNLRKNKFSTVEYIFCERYNSLVTGCLSYYDKIGEDFTYNHKTFTESLYKGFREVGITYKEIKSNNLKRVQGIKWHEGIFAPEFELDTGTEKTVKEEFMDASILRDQLNFFKECNKLFANTPYLGNSDLILNENFFTYLNKIKY